jgi:four helix bundle protein
LCGRTEITSYRDLLCWQKAMDLALLAYALTDKFPRQERFGLAFHMRKTAVAVPSNIAEGTRHRTPGYIARIVIALGEHAELETQATLGQRLGYIDEIDMAAFEALSASTGQLTHGLLRSLDKDS